MKWIDLFRRPTERDRFAELVIRRAKERGWPHKITYDRDDFRLDMGVGDAKLFLQNGYNEWVKGDATTRPRDIERLISTIFEIDNADDLAAALPLLLPIVRNRRELESYWLDPSSGFERGSWTGAYRPLCDAIAVGLAIDRPNSLALVGAKYLETWGEPFETLLNRAVLNLRAISPAKFERDEGGFYISQYDDQYDCSRLLLPELLDLLSLKGDPVAIAIARNGMVVAGSMDTRALLAMGRFVEEKLEEATRPISYLPLLRKHGAWVVFNPVEPELAPLRDLRAKQTLWDYEFQREALERHFGHIKRDVYVAKIDARRYDEGIYGIATWGQGVQALLPRTDAVAIFSGKDGPFFIRSWEHFWSVFGDVLADDGLYPYRYLTPPTIDEARLSRLQREFAEPDWLPPLQSSNT